MTDVTTEYTVARDGRAALRFAWVLWKRLGKDSAPRRTGFRGRRFPPRGYVGPGLRAGLGFACNGTGSASAWLVMVRDDNWKFYVCYSPDAGDSGLYNLADDPFERRNLHGLTEFADQQARVQALIDVHLTT
jgi:hypothetical protein